MSKLTIKNTKNCFKALIAIFMSSIMIFGASVSLFAYEEITFDSNAIIFNIIEEIFEDGAHIQVLEYNGVYYHYHATTYQTTVVTINTNTSTVDMYHRNHVENFISHDSVAMINAFSFEDNVNPLNSIYDIANMISNGEMNLSGRIEVQYSDSELHSISPRNSVLPFHRNQIAAMGITEVIWARRGTHTDWQTNLTGHKYTTTFFSFAGNRPTVTIRSGITAAAVAATFLIPVAHVGLVVRMVIATGGALVTQRETINRSHNIHINSNHSAVVAPQLTVVRASGTVRNVIRFILNVDTGQYVGIHVHAEDSRFNFTDTTSFILQGIRNFRG